MLKIYVKHPNIFQALKTRGLNNCESSFDLRSVFSQPLNNDHSIRDGIELLEWMEGWTDGGMTLML